MDFRNEKIISSTILYDVVIWMFKTVFTDDSLKHIHNENLTNHHRIGEGHPWININTALHVDQTNCKSWQGYTTNYYVSGTNFHPPPDINFQFTYSHSVNVLSIAVKVNSYLSFRFNSEQLNLFPRRTLFAQRALEFIYANPFPPYLSDNAFSRSHVQNHGQLGKRPTRFGIFPSLRSPLRSSSNRKILANKTA